MLLKPLTTQTTRLAKMDVPLSDHLTIIGHYDECLLRSKQDDLLAVIELKGLFAQTQSPAQLEQYRLLWADLLTSLPGEDISIYFHVVQKHDERRPHKACMSGIAQTINQRYYAAQSRAPAFYQAYYITLIHRGPQNRAMLDFYKNLNFKKHASSVHQHLQQAKAQLNEVVQRFMHNLKAYQPKQLRSYQAPLGTASQPLEFMHYLVNLTDRIVYLTEQDYRKVLPAQRIQSNKQTLTWQHAHQNDFAHILGIKAYAAQTWFAHLNDLLSLPGRFILTQFYQPRAKATVLSMIDKQKNRLLNAQDKAQSQIKRLEIAADQVAGGEIAYGDHSLSLMCIADNQNALNDLTSQAEAMCIDLGLHTLREDLNLDMAYFSSIPGNAHYQIRLGLINTLNVTDLSTFNNAYQGEVDGSIWGEPITLLRARSGQNIFFNFHVDKSGSTAIYGLTGSGKTLLTDFLLLQATKFISQGLRIFFFDYLRGSEPFIRALGGDYVQIGQHQQAFNPLQMPDTAENRKDLATWLGLLVAEGDTPLTHREQTCVHAAVDTIYDNPQAFRTLSELAPTLALPQLRERLNLWLAAGAKSQYFGACVDELSFDNPILGIDMTVVLKDQQALAPILFYLFMRIRHAMQQTAHAPFIIVLEEGWSLLRSALFRDILEEWILTIRRLNGLVIFLTQNPEHLMQYAHLSDIINANAQTKIYFPNYQASEDVYCKLLGLSEHEFSLVKNTPKHSRYFLLKQAEHSCLATVSLHGLEDYIPLLSGDMKRAERCEKLRAQCGNDIEKWLPRYLAECQEGA